MSRIPEYTRGQRDGIRWAITWLHSRAREMNDPHAKGVLNSAAFNMGVAAKAVIALSEEAPSAEDHLRVVSHLGEELGLE